MVEQTRVKSGQAWEAKGLRRLGRGPYQSCETWVVLQKPMPGVRLHRCKEKRHHPQTMKGSHSPSDDSKVDTSALRHRQVCWIASSAKNCYFLAMFSKGVIMLQHQDRRCRTIRTAP